MGLFNRRNKRKAERELDVRRRESQRIAQEMRNQFFSSPLCSDYENMFAQVRPLIDEMINVRPFGIGKNGAKLPTSRTPELNLLDYPNEDMGWAEFADLMFATWLTKDQLYIHAWHDGRGNLKGYTVLPSSSRQWLGNRWQWQVQTAAGHIETLTEDEVMTLRFSRSPDDPDKGISPASSVRIWTQVDDVISQYQRAYFENGAIPATLTFITASTQERYDAVRNELERKTRGADNANKTVYIWRQMLPETGETKDQVEIKTIQAPNSTLAIKDIVAIVNDKLNKSIGVSNFILGDDSSAKYDNAELSDYQFTRRRVYPALLKFWSQFQHELDRITGGLGYAISFELELPDLTERLKTKAEIAKTTAETLTGLINAGASAEFATKALKLDADWFNAGIGIQTKRDADAAFKEMQTIAAIRASQTATEAKAIDQQPEPTAQIEDGRHCGCSHHTDAGPVIFGDDERTEKTIYDKLISLARAIVAENPNFDEELIKNEIWDLLEEQAAAGGNVSLEHLADLVEDPETERIIKEALTQGYDISDALTDRIKERTNLIVNDYSMHTREQMRAVLANAEELTAEEIQERLEQVIPYSRAATIARNETVYAFRSGRLDADMETAKQFGFEDRLQLTWRCTQDSKTCDVCAAMDGETTIIGKAYNDQITKPAGTLLANGNVLEKDETYSFRQDQWNDQGQIPSAHVNCRCYFDERII